MDLQIIQILNTVPITHVGSATGIGVPTLEILGKDFSSAEEVHINDIPSPDFIIVSNNKILAQVPNLGGDSISKIEVFSSKLTNVDESKILFGLSPHTKVVSGIEQLLQRFLKIAFTKPGSDAFNPSMGGGLRSQVGVSTDIEGRSVSAGVAIAFNVARTQILKLQQSDANISPDERLIEATIIDSHWNPRKLTLDVKILVKNESGSILKAQVGVNNE
jgi:hypothetical protein